MTQETGSSQDSLFSKVRLEKGKKKSIVKFTALVFMIPIH